MGILLHSTAWLNRYLLVSLVPIQHAVKARSQVPVNSPSRYFRVLSCHDVSATCYL